MPFYCYYTAWLSVSPVGPNIDPCGTASIPLSRKGFGRREIALCPSYCPLCRNFIICIYFPLSTEWQELVSFEKPSHGNLYSPQRDRGITQPYRAVSPSVAKLWAAWVQAELKFTHFSVRPRAQLPEETGENASASQSSLQPTLAATAMPVESFPQFYIELFF